jgi:hypothetical protein
VYAPAAAAPAASLSAAVTAVCAAASRLPGAYNRRLFDSKVSAFCGIGGAYNFFMACLGGCKGHQGLFRVDFVSDSAQAELNGGRVNAPAACPLRRPSPPR